MKKLIVYSFWFSVFGHSAFSQADKQTEDTITRSLGEVIVTVQRKETNQLLVPYTVQSLNRDQLDELNPRTTPEAMMAVNGVFVQKTNHGGGSPFMRGLTGNQTLILVDGVRMNNSTFRYGPNQYLNTIDAYTVNRIEVAKGTGSVQYGTDALGGVIQILTREPQLIQPGNRWQGKVLGRYMTGGMEKTGRGELGFSGKKMAVMAGVTYRNFGDIIGGDTTGRQSPSGYKELAADVKAKFLLNKDWQLTLAHQSVQQQHVQVYHKVVMESFAVNEMDPQKRMLNYAKLRGNTGNRFFRQVELIVSWQQNAEGRSSQKNGNTVLRKEKDKVSTAGFTVDVLSIISKQWTANSGIELYCDRVSSARKDIDQTTAVTKDLRGLYPDGSKYGNYSLYTLHHFSFNKWMADIGGRINLFDIRITDTTLGAVRLTPSAIVCNAALLYRLSRYHAVYTSVSTGYRAPNVDDMGTLGIVDFRYEVPAHDLQPERSVHSEAGYKFSNRRVSGNISLFYMHLENIITRVKSEGQVINGYPVYKKENSEKAFLKGTEAELNWKVTGRWNLSGAIAYTYGQNLTKKEPLRRVPPLNGRMMATYRQKKWFTSAEFLFASKQDRLAQGDKDDNRIPAGGTPGWKVINFYGGYKFSNMSMNAGFQNIFNADYRTHGSGINGVGRSGWLSVAVKI